VFANLGHLGIGFEVVIAVGQRQAALIDVGDDLIGVVQVRGRVKIEQRVGPDEVHPGQRVNQRDLVLGLCNPVEFRL
jgi:hypothetical protein